MSEQGGAENYSSFLQQLERFIPAGCSCTPSAPLAALPQAAATGGPGSWWRSTFRPSTWRLSSPYTNSLAGDLKENNRNLFISALINLEDGSASVLGLPGNIGQPSLGQVAPGTSPGNEAMSVRGQDYNIWVYFHPSNHV